MREYKFRSWIPSIKEFVYFANGEYSHKNVHSDCVFDWENAEQFTGLKDVTGKEIYEGDIVTNGETNFQIIFYFGSFRCSVLPNKIRIYEIGTMFENLEIIGNIHENQELLELDK